MPNKTLYLRARKRASNPAHTAPRARGEVTMLDPLDTDTGASDPLMMRFAGACRIEGDPFDMGSVDYSFSVDTLN